MNGGLESDRLTLEAAGWRQEAAGRRLLASSARQGTGAE